MLGLSAVPVGDVRFDLQPATGSFNVTFPTKAGDFPTGKKAVVEYIDGVATREFGYNSTTKKYTSKQELGTALRAYHNGESDFRPYENGLYRPYTPGLQINVVGSFYLPTYEWKVVPEEMPLLWIAPMWAFLTGLLVFVASMSESRDLLLNVSIP